MSINISGDKVCSCLFVGTSSNDHVMGNASVFIEAISAFGKEKNIDSNIVIKMLYETFRMVIIDQFKIDNNFTIIIDLEHDSIQIMRSRRVVEQKDGVPLSFDEISLSEAKKIEKDFDIGDEVVENLDVSRFQFQTVKKAFQKVLQKLKNDIFYNSYKPLMGDVITVSLSSIDYRKKEFHVSDTNGDILIFPISECEHALRTRLSIGDRIRVIVSRIEVHGGKATVYVSRTSHVFLEKMLMSVVPEITDGLVKIVKIARYPGERSKIVVMSENPRIDPVSACIGPKRARIEGISRELNERIDIIQYTNSENVYINRVLGLTTNLAKEIHKTDAGLFIYVDGVEDIAQIVGKGGVNINLASEILNTKINVFKYDNNNNSPMIDECADSIEDWIIEVLKNCGYTRINDILETPKEVFEKVTDLETETVDNIYKTLNTRMKNYA